MDLQPSIDSLTKQDRLAGSSETGDFIRSHLKVGEAVDVTEAVVDIVD